MEVLFPAGFIKNRGLDGTTLYSNSNSKSKNLFEFEFFQFQFVRFRSTLYRMPYDHIPYLLPSSAYSLGIVSHTTVQQIQDMVSFTFL